MKKKIIFLFLIFIKGFNCSATYTYSGSSTSILTIGQKIRLQNGQYDLMLKSDNNLVILQSGINQRWNTGTAGTGGDHMVFQTDGNLVLFTAANLVVWNSGTSGNIGSTLVFNDFGLLQIKSSTNTVLWQSTYVATQTWLYAYTTNYNTTTTTVPTKVIIPEYATDDAVVAEYNAVTDFGADNTGISDASVAIQSALNMCNSNGGGTVWLPKGRYRIRNTITIPLYCTLRGDWNDPDDGVPITSVGDYGTMILVDFPSNESGNYVFTISDHSAGIMGLTIYYPHQNAYSPVPYNYVISLSYRGYMTVKNITFINAYKGIFVDGTIAHGVCTFKNIKGCCLKQAFYNANEGEPDVMEDITFNNTYWANAPHNLNPPSIFTLNNWTRANGIGLKLGDLEWIEMTRLSVSNYNIGVNTVPGVRDWFKGLFVQLSIDNCNTGIQFDDYYHTMPSVFVNCNISGSSYAVKNNLAYIAPSGSKTYNIPFNHCTINGYENGYNISEFNSPTVNPPMSAKLAPQAIPHTSRNVLYNVGLAPYNCPRVIGNDKGCLPTVDATTFIQSALIQAGNDGGGIVYLPAGFYRLDGTLTVPANVELRGVSAVSSSEANSINGSNKLGTSILVYNGHNVTNPVIDTAAITLLGNNSGISGLKFFYPGRANVTDGDTPYPYTIRGVANNIYVKNTTFENNYYGLDFATNSCNNYYIERLNGVASHTFINVGGNSEAGGIIKNIDCNPIYWQGAVWTYRVQVSDLTIVNGSNVFNYSLANETFINVGGNSTSTGTTEMTNVFAYGAKNNIINSKPNSIVYNLGQDGSGSGTNTITATQPIIIENLFKCCPASIIITPSSINNVTLYNDTEF